jgi:hypothetical protein
VGPAPRHAGTRRDRPSGLQLRQLPGRAGAAGRAEPEALATARFGPHLVTAGDTVFADDDGALFAAAQHTGQVLATAHQIWQTERDQARQIREGQTLRQQTRFGDYLARRATDPSYTFRRHLRRIGGAIEE